ncbi:TIGR02391 family protein [Aquisphaera insulae]|uniref:TIGR02391 family protein n=1 Tax=Aquisphaera insulae TaxID=2712864 RepID=UPI00196A92CA|nr:TIGR02391 family protein [Aquisphaera insulae]
MTMMSRNQVPLFDAQHMEAICRILGDTENGLTGSEIANLLRDCRIPDTSPDMTKWKRLFNAFIEFQNKHQMGNHVLVFVKRAMAPARYLENPASFHARRNRLNTLLALRGMTLGEDGQFRKADAAKTVDEALERANRLHAALVQRDVHRDVLRFCTVEIIQQNYFHAVFEAMKSITAKIRTLSGLSNDGVDLIHAAFGQNPGPPLLALNPLQTDTQRGEQRGFMNLLKGLYGTIRNPLAHDPKVEWDMTEQDALDILTTISLVHRKIDQARRSQP